MSIRAEHQSFLADRAITPSAAAAAGLHTVSAGVARRHLFGQDGEGSVPGDALCIPYMDLHGQPVLGEDGVQYERFRVFDVRTDDELGGGKRVRYMARTGCGRAAYLPAGLAELLEEKHRFVVVTEGELKALSATRHGIPTIGIPGVTMWSTQEAGGELSENSPVLPEILAAARKLGGCVVLADSDAVDNRMVRSAMTKLAAAIAKQAGVPCAYTPLVLEERRVRGRGRPSEAAAAKVGLDDAIAQADGDIGRIFKLLDSTFRKAQVKDLARKNCPYIPLGFDGTASVVWSKVRSCIMALGVRDISSSSALAIACGGNEWPEAAYGEADDKGNVRVDWQALANDVIVGCQAAGPYNAGCVRGSGVWLAEDGGLVVAGRDGVWRSDGSPIERYTKEHVYPITGVQTGIRYDSEIATTEDAEQVMEALLSWGWARRGTDEALMLGWLGLAYIPGALPWRPHASLTGPAGTGKSELQRFLSELLGSAALAVDGGSTEAGLRQHVGANAIALLIDESEADGKHLANQLTFLRSASDDKVRAHGTSDGAGRTYTMRTIGLLSGIVPPDLNAADRSRFVRFELRALNKEAVAKPHPLIRAMKLDDGTLRNLGKRLYRRMVDQYANFLQSVRVIRAHIQGGTRLIDAMAPILAAFHTLLDDEVISDEGAITLIDALDIAANVEEMSTARDEDDALRHLLTTQLRVDGANGTQTWTVAQAAAVSAAEKAAGDRLGDFTRALGNHGIAVSTPEPGGHVRMYMHPKATGFRSLFRNSKWEAGDLQSVLRRAAGANNKLTDGKSIGGCTARAVEIQVHVGASPREIDHVGRMDHGLEAPR